MDNKVASIAPPSADPGLTAPPPRPVPQDTGANPPGAAGQDQADLRLIIEEDSGTGSYVYKTVDRRTGEIVQQFPREEILRMHDENEYAPGDVIRARV